MTNLTVLICCLFLTWQVYTTVPKDYGNQVYISLAGTVTSQLLAVIYRTIKQTAMAVKELLLVN